MFSQSENQNTFQCVRTTFGHQRLPFSTKQDLANGWKKLFLETKKTTQQWAMTRSLFANIAFGSNSNPSFVCVRYSIREIFYSSKCTYLPCWGAVSGSSWWVMTPSSKSCPPLWIWRAWHITEWLNTQQSEFTKMWIFFFQNDILYKIHPLQNWSAGSQLSSRRGICQIFYTSKIPILIDLPEKNG